MTGGEFAELVRACTLASIRRTARRSPAAAEHARRNLDDVTQAAALEALERITAGADGDPAQIVSRAANAVIIREYRRSARQARQETPYTTTNADGDEIPRPELETRRDAPQRPTEDASTAAALIEAIIEQIPRSLRPDAPKILHSIAAGATTAEAAAAAGVTRRQAQRIVKASREAAERTA